jgi:predicted MFS family arabinose efflux permease
LILSTITAGVAMLVLFVIVELTQQRPMLDMSLFRQPAFVGVSLSTFAIGAGMFAMFPYLSIYLQDVLGTSPLGAGLRFLPLTVFVFVVPLATRNIALRSPAWLLAGVGLVLVAVSLFLMYGVSASSHWTTLLAGFVVGGIGIGLANPTLAAAALRVVDPARSGMASGFNNTCRLAGVAIGVAGLGAVLEHAVGNSLATNGHRGLAQAVSSSGENVAHGQPLLAHLAAVAFAHGLNAALITGCIVVAAGAISAFALMRMGGAPVAAPEAAASSSSSGA